MNYEDLIELARLCLLRASAARTPAAANSLRRMAEEYQARAAALKGEEPPDNIAEGALGPSVPEAPSSVMQQQQQPHGGSVSADPQSSPSTPKPE